MKSFVVNRHGNLFLPANLFSQIDFSVINSLDQFEAIVRRDIESKAPSGTEIFERITAGAHEFTELRLLGALRSGTVTLPTRDAEDGERLLGDAGSSPAARLGLAPDAQAPELAEAAYAALERWQRHTVNPMLGRTTAQACRSVVRSCEGILAGLS